MRERVEGGCGMARVGRDGGGDESGYALRANPTYAVCICVDHT